MGNLDIESKNWGIREQDSERSSPNFQYAAFASWPLKPKFRLGAELGMANFKHNMETQITDEQNTVYNYLGVYQIQQIYAAIVPEYRPIDWFFLNGGAGIFVDTKSRFDASAKRFNGPLTEDITNQSYKRSNPFGLFVGAGFCKNFSKNLAVLLEARLTASPASVKDKNTLGISYNAMNFNLGLMYKIRQ